MAALTHTNTLPALCSCCNVERRDSRPPAHQSAGILTDPAFQLERKTRTPSLCPPPCLDQSAQQKTPPTSNKPRSLMRMELIGHPTRLAGLSLEGVRSWCVLWTDQSLGPSSLTQSLVLDIAYHPRERHQTLQVRRPLCRPY